MFKRDYLHDAQTNETIFKWILKDLKDNRNQRPMWGYIPEDLDTTSDIPTLYQKYSTWARHGIFTILDFALSPKDSSWIKQKIFSVLNIKTSPKQIAEITFQNVAFMSWGWVVLKYEAHADKSIKYIWHGMIRRS